MQRTEMPEMSIPAPTVTLTVTVNPEYFLTSLTAGLPLLHAGDDLLHNAFGMPVYGAASSGGEMLGHSSEVVRQVLTAMDNHAAAVA